MKNSFRRISAYLLIFSGAIGVALSLVSLVVLWLYKQPVESALIHQIDNVNSALKTTSEGLNLVSQSLSTTTGSVSTLENTVETLAQSIQDTTPMIDTLSIFISEDLPATITSTQTSLIAAQSSARIIDNVLGIVTKIPFFPGEPYNPPVPLHIALGRVSSSLDDLPRTFIAMDTSLKATSQNLTLIQANIHLIAKDISQVKQSLSEANQVVSQYQLLVSRLQKNLKNMQTQAPLWLDALAWALTIFLVWIGSSQVGLLLLGLDILRSLVVV